MVAGSVMNVRAHLKKEKKEEKKKDVKPDRHFNERKIIKP